MGYFTITTEPIDRWPEPDSTARLSPQFKASYNDTLRLLRSELEHLDTAGAVAIQIVTKNGAADLRRDGMLRAGSQTTHPGVRISFTCQYGDLTYATDTFESRWRSNTPDWQHNLRAIALGLQALRAVDRYGISRSGEQYRGWSQLPGSTGSSAGMSRDIATAVLAEEAGLSLDAAGATLAARVGVPALVKAAKRNAHPDVNKGDQTHWDALTQALAALGLAE